MWNATTSLAIYNDDLRLIFILGYRWRDTGEWLASPFIVKVQEGNWICSTRGYHAQKTYS